MIGYVREKFIETILTMSRWEKTVFTLTTLALLGFILGLLYGMFKKDSIAEGVIYGLLLAIILPLLLFIIPLLILLIFVGILFIVLLALIKGFALI